MTEHENRLIYEWNTPSEHPPWKLKLNDETLRDGLQSPSVTDPPIKDKLEILHYMEDLGMSSAAIGLPAAGPHAYNDVLAIATEIADKKLNIYPYCAARTIENDIISIAAYNAGPTAVKRWISSHGDPRSNDLDTIDWIEMIPYRETRNYVQRVLENLTIYRRLVGETKLAYLIRGR